MSILFNEIVFGPVKSRRLGLSLGINLMPLHAKICSYDCVYCECGLNAISAGNEKKLFKGAEIIKALQHRFAELHEKGLLPDSITFSGNGEPTLHPNFEAIIDETIRLRDTFFPKANISVLSNASQLHKQSVKRALLKVDNNLLKLDAGSERTYRLIDRPNGTLTLAQLVEQLVSFNGNVTIQTILVRGQVQNEFVDNTTEEELNLWLQHIERIKPKKVMLYPIDRATPFDTLEKVPKAEFDALALRLKEIGIRAEVSYS